MRRLLAVLVSAIFLVIAPGFVAGVVPWWISRWRLGSLFFGIAALRLAGAALAVAGAVALLACFARFALQGLGTPAPVFPTRRLVIGGTYRYVRNPMYVAVVAIILGQALWFANGDLLAYGAVVWALFHAFVLVYEEPTLRAAFGADYEEFRRQVPRWIPKLRK